jgi:hypothetical protein
MVRQAHQPSGTSRLGGTGELGKISTLFLEKIPFLKPYNRGFKYPRKKTKNLRFFVFFLGP